jgi:pyridoxal 5'-phosphate synthase pdxS subunit
MLLCRCDYEIGTQDAFRRRACVITTSIRALAVPALKRSASAEGPLRRVRVIPRRIERSTHSSDRSPIRFFTRILTLSSPPFLAPADVIDPAQARISEDAGAVAVMALERVPADIRHSGGVARMSDPEMILGIKKTVTLPVMAKARIGHFVEAQVLEALEVDYIDESEVLTIADEDHHIDKTKFKVPFVCGCRNLGEGLRRIAEGAAMLRTKGEAGTGNVVEAVRHARTVNKQIKQVCSMDTDELYAYAKDIQAPLELVREVKSLGRLPVVNFAAGGIATPADAALMMQLGMDGVFVGSGIFKSGDPFKRAKAIVAAVTHYNDPKVIAEVSAGLGDAMSGLGNIRESQVAFRERGH